MYKEKKNGRTFCGGFIHSCTTASMAQGCLGLEVVAAQFPFLSSNQREQRRPLQCSNLSGAYCKNWSLFA